MQVKIISIDGNEHEKVIFNKKKENEKEMDQWTYYITALFGNAENKYCVRTWSQEITNYLNPGKILSIEMMKSFDGKQRFKINTTETLELNGVKKKDKNYMSRVEFEEYVKYCYDLSLAITSNRNSGVITEDTVNIGTNPELAVKAFDKILGVGSMLIDFESEKKLDDLLNKI